MTFPHETAKYASGNFNLKLEQAGCNIYKILNKPMMISYASYMEISNGRKLARSAQDVARRKTVQAVISARTLQAAAGASPGWRIVVSLRRDERSFS